MSESEATPGPWQNDDSQEYYGGHVIRMNGVVICRMLTSASSPGPDETAANARLIAQAPELRQLVAEALDHFCESESEMDIKDWVKAATAVLAKVEGTK